MPYFDFCKCMQLYEKLMIFENKFRCLHFDRPLTRSGFANEKSPIWRFCSITLKNCWRQIVKLRSAPAPKLFQIRFGFV